MAIILHLRLRLRKLHNKQRQIRPQFQNFLQQTTCQQLKFLQSRVKQHCQHRRLHRHFYLVNSLNNLFSFILKQKVFESVLFL